MSSLILTGDTSGTITLAAPAVAGTHTLTMPVATGTVILEDASGVLQMNSGYGSLAPAYGCRAWVNFNGTSTVAIRDSGNVSSITDNGTGDYTVNFTTAMPDANYSIVGTAQDNGSEQRGVFSTFNTATAYPLTTSTARFRVTGNSTTASDSQTVTVSIFR